MQRNSFILLFVFLTACFCKTYAQEKSQYIADHAIEIKWGEQNKKLQEELKSYDLIMVGEMHGMQESIRVIDYLAQNFLSAGNNVQIGFELPIDELQFVKPFSKTKLRHSKYYTRCPRDGRESTELFDLICKYATQKNVRVFFYDSSGFYENHSDGDSMMYMKIKKNLIQHPAYKTITLSGNVHTMSNPYNQTKPIAYYFLQDDLFSKKILNINIDFNQGSSYICTAKGLKEEFYNSEGNELSLSTNYKQYFCLLPKDTPYPYRAFIYIETIHPSHFFKCIK